MIAKITRAYYGFAWLNALSFSFFFATYQLFLKSHGLGSLEINLVALSFVVFKFFLEIPTGSFADNRGRQKSIVLGCAVTALSFFGYYFAHSFWQFVLAEMTGALGTTFISGAIDAWLVDTLHHHGFTGKLETIYANESLFHFLGLLVGSLGGAYLGSVNLSLPWLFSGSGLLLLGVFSLFKMKEDYFPKQKWKFSFNLQPIQRTARQSIEYGVKHRSIFYILIFGAILAASLEAVNKQWSLAFNDLGLNVKQLGWLFNGISLCLFLGSRLALSFGRLIKKEKDRVIISQLVTAAGIIIAACFLNLSWTLSGFFLHEIGRGLFKPLKQAYLNRRLATATRATVLSFDSMISQLGSGLGLIGSGIIASRFSIGWAWLASGLIVLIAVPIFLKLKNGD